MIYLDYAASTPVDEQIKKIIFESLETDFANPSSVHALGRQSRFAIDSSREAISNLIGAKPLELIFTASGTEANNLAIKGAISANLNCGKHVISSLAEHKSVLNTLKHLAKNKTIELDFVHLKRDGSLDLDHFKSLLKPSSILVSIMHVNNELGVINPIDKIGKMCKENGTLFHSDAVQSFGKISLNIQNMFVDLLSTSSHKLYGPKGSGFLYIKKGSQIKKIIDGASQEFDMRAGTENISFIVAFSKASELSIKDLDKNFKKVMKLNRYFRQRIKKEITNIRFNTPKKNISPFILNVSFSGCSGEAFVMNMDQRGVCLSSGSACTSGALGPSTVIKSLNIEEEFVESAIRFSFGKHTTISELDIVIEKIKEVLSFLRKN